MSKAKVVAVVKTALVALAAVAVANRIDAAKKIING